MTLGHFLNAVHEQDGLHILIVEETPGDVSAKCKTCGWLRVRTVGAGETPQSIRKMLEEDFRDHASLRRRVENLRRKARERT